MVAPKRALAVQHGVEVTTPGRSPDGRKVFILNPHSVVRDELVDAILSAEYELYLISDSQRALKVFKQFPDSIVFINIDSGLKEREWERYVRRLVGTTYFKHLSIGILSYNPDPKLIEKYLMEIGVACGFVRLSLGAQESTRIMLQTLEANEARGRRRYVRSKAENDKRASFNFRHQGREYDGGILDISSVGMAIRFSRRAEIPAKALLTDMQLKLRASLVRVTGVVLGRREDDKTVYVVLFKHERDSKARRLIRQYIHKSLQEYIDKMMGDGG
jgi:hypothetical protein